MQATELTTPCLLPRPPQARDLDASAAFAADPETMRYLGGVQGRSAAWRAMMCMAGPKASVWKAATQMDLSS